MAEDGFQFPLEFLFLFIQDVQIDPSDFSEDAKVSYENAKTIIDIFSNTPTFSKSDTLNSDNTKIALDHNNRTVEMLAPKVLMNFDAMGD